MFEEYDVKYTFVKPEDWNAATHVGSGVSVCGMALALHEVACKLMDEMRLLGKSTDWVNKHPIVILYVDAMSGRSSAWKNSIGLDAWEFADDMRRKLEGQAAETKVALVQEVKPCL
jgi:hypothetical protein